MKKEVLDAAAVLPLMEETFKKCELSLARLAAVLERIELMLVDAIKADELDGKSELD